MLAQLLVQEVEGRIVVVPEVQVVHVVQGAVVDVEEHNVLVVGPDDVVGREVGRQDAGTAECLETSESRVMIDTQ